MIRHMPKRNETMSFFAFMSIISCAIGLLMFVLVGVTIVSFWGAEQVIMNIPQSEGGKAGAGRIYVECRSDGLIIHPDKTLVALADLEDTTRWMETPFAECLGKLSDGEKTGSIFFLVRKDGLDLFRKALGYAFLAGGGTADAVAQGRARFTMGQQMVTMPGPIKVIQGEDKQTR